MHPTPHRLTGAVAAATLAWASAACGNVTVGGFTEVTVDVSGNAPTAAPSPQPALLAGAAGLSTSPSAGPLPTSHEEEEAEGEVEVDFTLALLSESGDVVPLGRDDIRIKLDLQGVDEAEAVKELVPTAHYTELRITFTHIKVEVHAGLVIDGQEITGEIEVELEDPELVVGRPVDLEAIEGSRVELLVDLNTPAWLGAVDPATRTIDASVFAGLIDLVVR
jgi:hypothetical protein